jgi:pilus assembly protein Flp/PilA
MATTLQNLLLDESGQDLIEYALIASLLALGAVASLKSLGSSISLFLDSVGSSLTSAI